ncbi:DUF1178 family protein [Thermopetrobacter sp. TC1]|uniref:DUF1178 family protein n=1 Tax=Thermopetrobacter sp. TC1 TaxID=1495045 RepID=UPI000571E9CE|nr:DUF1178 family protein [Thermopetrobacter sp. TC1]
MIRYDLTCSRGHEFDGWFSDSASFEAQQAQGLIECPICGDTNIRRQLACPGIPVKGNRRPEPQPRPAGQAAQKAPQAPAPLSEGEAALLRQFAREINTLVRERAEYVGDRFAEESRRRHAEGTAAEQPIWGEASPQEVQELREEGIEVMPLPPMPDEKN